MSVLAAYAAYIASGSTGASHSLLSSYGPSALPGQKMWLTFIYEATRTTGTGVLTLDAKVHWYDVNDVEIGSPSTTSIAINASIGRTFKEFQVTVPANATKCKVEFVATPAASPMQHDLWISKVRLGKTQLLATAGATWGQDIADPAGTLPEDNATVDAFIACASPIIVYADINGVPKTGQLNKVIAVNLNRLGANLTSGVTWAATLMSGNATFTITGTGSATFTITGPNNSTLADESIIRLQATYAGVARILDVKVIKQNDPPTNASGGGGTSGSTATTSTLGNTNGTTYDLVNAISATLTAQAGPNGEVSCTTTLNFIRLVQNSLGQTGTFGKWQWRVPAGAWADIFTEAASSANSRTRDVGDPGDPIYDTSTGGITVNQIKNGLTPGSTYEFRFAWRRSDVAGTASDVTRTSGILQAQGQ